MPAKDIAIKNVETADPDDPVAEIATRMADGGVGSVVVTEDHRPVGIVTDRDLAVRVLAAGADPDGLCAGDVMTADPATARSTAGVLELAAAICEAGVRRMPIVDDGDHIVGIVTLDDLLLLFVEELDELSEVIATASH
ncbi:MAG: CBS domain-containing protein [Halobacteriaceae archaeon]